MGQGGGGLVGTGGEGQMSDHALWSASATKRNWACPGALALTKDLPEQTSHAADWGTVCHAIAADCLFDPNKQPEDFIGRTLKGKVHEFEVDDEMAETAGIYVDYCRERIAAYKAETGQNALVFVEEKFTLDGIKPPFEAGGTADFVAIFPKWQLIEVVDLKTGRGVVVEVKDNPQARTYALGAVLRHQGHAITMVKATIVQSRAPHKDGRIRSESFHIADLAEWTADLLGAMRHSAQALADFDLGGMSQAEWATAYLRPGDHCGDTFCKAQATCPALRQKALDVVGVWFDDVDQPHVANTPEQSPDERAKRLDLLDMIEDWVKAVRADEHVRAEGGDPATGYVLVPKQGREKWLDGVEEQVIGAAVLARLPEAKYLNPGKLRTPKQVRKELGAQAKLVDGLSTTPDAGTNLVRADKTTREPVAGTATRYFEAQQ